MERIEDRVAFLRRAARELRKLAGGAPEIAAALHQLARELDGEADDLAAPGGDYDPTIPPGR